MTRALLWNVIAAAIFLAMLLIPAWHYWTTGLPR